MHDVDLLFLNKKSLIRIQYQRALKKIALITELVFSAVM
jgi:hypothetical protein